MPVAILFVDLTGFSDAMEADEWVAIHLVGRFREAAEKIVMGHEGVWLKAWADNFAATFPTVGLAKECAEFVQHCFACGAGIGWGEVKTRFGDFFGVEVNRASKLGEDVARAGEILLTDAAREQLEREKL